jgi:hypothetical protein
MPFFSVLRHFSNPSDASESADVARDPSSGNSDESSRQRRDSEPTRTQPWTLRRKGASAISRARSSPPIEPTLFKIRKAKNSAPNTPVREIPVPMPLPASPGIIATDMAVAPPREIITTTSPLQDLFAATCDEVKDGLKGDSAGHSLNALGRYKSVLVSTWFYFYF